MRKMHAANGNESTIQQRQTRLIVDPEYVIKKNQSRGPRHGLSVRQIMYHKARDMLRKAKLPKNGLCETILERWYADAYYQKSLSDEGWTEEKIRQYDTLALEDHSYEATHEERRR